MSKLFSKPTIHSSLYYVCHFYDYVVIMQGYLYNKLTQNNVLILNDLAGNELSFNTQEEALLWVANNVKPEYIDSTIPEYENVYRIAKNRELSRKYFIF